MRPVERPVSYTHLDVYKRQAEALLATGIGLVAAIPAVVFYNKLNSDSEHILGGYEAFADEFATILSRQLDA